MPSAENCKMEIRSITIENFKGIRDPVSVEFKPITLLFGPNSAGKSTVVQALHYAREIFERENVDPGRTLIGGQSIDLGGFRALVHNHDLTLPIVLRFDLDLENVGIPEYCVAEDEDAFSALYPAWRMDSAWVEVVICWSLWLDKPILHSYEVGADGYPLARITSSEDGRQIILSYLNLEHPLFLDENTTDHSEQSSMLWALAENTLSQYVAGNDVEFSILGQSSPLPRWGKLLEFQDLWASNVTDKEVYLSNRNQFLSLISTLIVGPGEMVKDALCRFRYLGPLREVPSRSYEPARSPDESRWATGIAAWDVLYKSSNTFLEEVNDWLMQEERFNAGYRVEIKRYKELDVEGPLMLSLTEGHFLDDQDVLTEELENLPTKSRLYLREEYNDIEVLPQDVGIGISQVLPVIVAALHPKSGIVAIEQPELHIHPAFQVILGDLFISQIRNREVMFLVETHSEHLLLRLLRRIRETGEDELPPGIEGLTPDELAVFYVEGTGRGVVISELTVDETGDSSGRWPEGFFEERHAELF